MARKHKKHGKKRKQPKAPSGPTLADRADRHALYEQSVQEPEVDVEFATDVFRDEFGRRPRRLREDFCGTAALCRAWVQAHRENEAWGVDLDADVLAWGSAHNRDPLPSDQQQRMHLREGDVRDVQQRPVDVVMAQNFSYFLFELRDGLVEYFRAAHDNLADQGVLILDAYGGPDAQREVLEETEYDDFVYVWDQHAFDPIHQRAVCHIHYAFPDGSRLERAFTYSWRLYTIPEIREALSAAGFASSTVYWEGTDEDGEGDGVYTATENGEADDAWVVYIAGFKR